MFRPILSLIIVVFIVELARTVRVYEENDDDQEAVDITGNSNSTGPVVYPQVNVTDDSISNGTNEEITSDKPQTIKISSPLNQIANRTAALAKNDSAVEVSLRNNVSNNTPNQSTKVKENSSLNQRASYLHKVNEKPFVSSPIDIVARIVEQEKALNTDSFQPMIERPLIFPKPTQPPRSHPVSNQYHQTTPKSQIEEPVHSQTHLTSTRSNAQENAYHQYSHYHPPQQQHFEQGSRDSGRAFTFHEPQSQPHFHEQYNLVAPLSDKRPDSKAPPVLDYDQFKKNFFPPEMNLNEEQPRYTALQEYIQKNPQESGTIAWPEGQEEEKYKSSTTWTTEQPEFQTHPYKYLPTPTVYEPPKGFFSHALSFLSQSFKPSAPSHPYPFESGTEHPKSFTSTGAEYHFPTSPDQSDGKEGHKTYEKYEIITTSQPEYTFLSKPPSDSGIYHEVMKSPHHHNLPWHKIIKVLTAIIPIGLLVSALTPNVVLVSPNATNPNRQPIGNIYSYVTRQRSLEPEDAFSEHMVKILDGLLTTDSQDPGTACFKQAVCHALVTNKTESLLTREENMDFRNKICKNIEKVSTECDLHVE